MEWGFVLGLGGITLAVIGLFIYFGQKISKGAQKHAAAIDLPLYITPSGNVLFACMVAAWILCLATRLLKPESPLGRFLEGADGVFAVISASVFFGAIAAVVLEKLGYPVAKKGGQSD